MAETMSLLQSLVADLPSEPSRAIVVFAERVMNGIISVPGAKKPGLPEDYAAIVSFVVKFCTKYKMPVDLNASGANNYEHMQQLIARLQANRAAILGKVIDTEIDKILIQYDAGVGETFGVARLNGEEKKKIHDHIAKIRRLIEESDLSDRKMNALFDRLNELGSEVDAHGTSTDRFFGFLSDLGFVLGEFGKNAKPLFDEARGMIQAVSRARARQEGISLPPGDEPLRLPSPDEAE